MNSLLIAKRGYRGACQCVLATQRESWTPGTENLHQKVHLWLLSYWQPRSNAYSLEKRGRGVGATLRSQSNTLVAAEATENDDQQFISEPAQRVHKHESRLESIIAEFEEKVNNVQNR